MLWKKALKGIFLLIQLSLFSKSSFCNETWTWIQLGNSLLKISIKKSGIVFLIFNEGLVNVVQQYLKKGAQIYVEGQLTTRKWKDEQSGQDKYSTEIIIQGYNSSLTMLGGGNSGGGIANDPAQSSNNKDEMSQISNDMDDEIPF